MLFTSCYSMWRQVQMTLESTCGRFQKVHVHVVNVYMYTCTCTVLPNGDLLTHMCVSTCKLLLSNTVHE